MTTSTGVRTIDRILDPGELPSYKLERVIRLRRAASYVSA